MPPIRERELIKPPVGHLLVLFIAVPVVELALLIEIGQRVGTVGTIGLIMGTGIVVAQWIQKGVWGPVIVLGFEQRPPWCVTSPLSLERKEVQVANGQLAWPGDLHAHFFRVEVTKRGHWRSKRL